MKKEGGRDSTVADSGTSDAETSCYYFLLHNFFPNLCNIGFHNQNKKTQYIFRNILPSIVMFIFQKCPNSDTSYSRHLCK